LSHWANLSFSVIAGVLLLPVLVLCVEVLAAVFLRRRRRAPVDTRGAAVAVLIPAHDEELVIERTLRSIVPQLRDGDRLVVVADNCADATAAIARRCGAEVIERSDKENRGKGFALDYGIRHLATAPFAPTVVVMMDADCIAYDGAVDTLVAQVMATGRPAQAEYLLEAPIPCRTRDMASALAVVVKNVVRPAGLSRFNLPCLLTGTGMAFPWDTIRRAHLATGNIVEDMKLGVDLALAGHGALFCPTARVRGQLPSGAKPALEQRRRWEHGHLMTLCTVPSMLRRAVAARRWGAVAVALDVMIPPLSLLLIVMMAALFLAVGFGLAGWGWAPAVILASGGLALSLCVAAAWLKFARGSVPLAALAAAPLYLLWKVPLYVTYFFRRQREWVRTQRDVAPATTATPSSSSPAPVTPATAAAAAAPTPIQFEAFGAHRRAKV
jgi:cellulose synthase/poly-beta-1,6-N-acetylglucosamine synthase-like glycosyltransferase